MANKRRDVYYVKCKRHVSYFQTLKMAKETLLDWLDVGEVGSITHKKIRPYNVGYDVLYTHNYERADLLTLRRIH